MLIYCDIVVFFNDLWILINNFFKVDEYFFFNEVFCGRIKFVFIICC